MCFFVVFFGDFGWQFCPKNINSWICHRKNAEKKFETNSPKSDRGLIDGDESHGTIPFKKNHQKKQIQESCAKKKVLDFFEKSG